MLRIRSRMQPNVAARSRDGHRFESPQLHHEVRASVAGFPASRMPAAATSASRAGRNLLKPGPTGAAAEAGSGSPAAAAAPSRRPARRTLSSKTRSRMPSQIGQVDGILRIATRWSQTVQTRCSSSGRGWRPVGVDGTCVNARLVRTWNADSGGKRSCCRPELAKIVAEVLRGAERQG
jgi:hypothetical protein